MRQPHQIEQLVEMETTGRTGTLAHRVSMRGVVAAVLVLAMHALLSTTAAAQTTTTSSAAPPANPTWAAPTFGRTPPVAAPAPPRGGGGRVQSPGAIAPQTDSGVWRSPSFDRMYDAGPSSIVRPGASAFRPAPGDIRSRGDGRPGRDGRGRQYGPGFGYALPIYWGSYQAPLGVSVPGAAPRSGTAVAPGDVVGAPTVDAPAEAPHGFLRLLVTPRSAAVYVDGVESGTADDFGGSRERSLPAGAHRVRIEADGYEPVTIDVRVPVNDTITLRRALEPAPDAPATAVPQPAPRVAHKTLYFIPRCYLGDSVPAAEQLPQGCSLADLQTLP